MIENIKKNIVLANAAKEEKEKHKTARHELSQQKAGIPNKIEVEKDKIKQAGNSSKSLEDVEQIFNAANAEIERLKSEIPLINAKIHFLNNQIAEDATKTIEANRALSKSKELYINSLENKAIKNKDFMKILVEIKTAWETCIFSEGGGGMIEGAWIENLCAAVTDDPATDAKMLKIFGCE